ncbi:MAG: PAS domain S-box protein [Phycisphaerales bacterium]|nr:PAS domain S-box protein [Phycisphaerales bacterium]
MSGTAGNGSVAHAPESGQTAPDEIRARFRAFMQHLPAAAWIKDLAGRYLYANPEAQRIFGVPLSRLLGATDCDIFDAETARTFRQNDQRAAATPGALRTVESLRHADGNTHRSLVSKFAIAGEDEPPSGIGGVAFDITDLLAAQDALCESERRLRAVIEALPAAVYMCDAEGEITLYNAAAAALWGRTPIVGAERWCGASRLLTRDGELLAPDRCPMAVAVREARGIHAAEVMVERPDGTRRYALAHPQPILDSAGRVVGGVNMILDVTDRVEAAAELRAIESRFRLVADSAPTLIWMSGVDKRCTWFNRRWLEFTGRTMAQECGDGWIASVHPADRARCVATYEGAFDRRERFEMDYRLLRADGAYRWVRDVGVPICDDTGVFEGYVGSCIDVTEQLEGEAFLRDRVAQGTRELNLANEQLRQQIEQRNRIEAWLATENHILELIATQTEIAIVLDALCSALEDLLPGARFAIRVATDRHDPGAAQEVTEGVDVFGAIAREGVWPTLRLNRAALRGPRAVRRGRSDRLRERGFESFWQEPIVAPGGTVLGVLGAYSRARMPEQEALSATRMAARLAAIAIDRARTEERGRSQLEQLAHVARLATMGEMVSGLAHELNQPLCAIVNYAEAGIEMLAGGRAASPDLAKALSGVARQAERAGDVIRRSREFARRREPHRGPVDIKSTVRDVVALTRFDALQHEARVRMKFARRLPRVLADPIQVEQVLVNLVRNGLEAMRGIERRRRVLTIEATSRRGMVEVAVQDCGPGIAEAERRRLFEPFFTTKPDGMGMGLSISRSILEMHDGRIWCDASDSTGTTFRFRLPTSRRKSHAEYTDGLCRR